MMRKFLLFVAALVGVVQLCAAPVDMATAMATAQRFVQEKNYSGKLMAPLAGKLTLVHTEVNSQMFDRAAFYVFNTSNGYVIVSGDDRAEAILGYGDMPIDYNAIPCNMRAWLNSYKEQIEYLQAHEGMQVETPSMMSPSLRTASVAPLLTALWDQEAPYWNQCQFNGIQCMTGCPATSAAMVFYYWKYPDYPTDPVPSYKFSMSSGWSSTTVTVPELPSVSFDWDNMLDRYTSGYTTDQANAVATLMRYVGQAEQMEYGSDGSGIDAEEAHLIADAFKFFGYDEETVRLVKKTSAYSGGTTLYTDAEWAALIQEELTEERPIVFCAIDGGFFGGGHAFNVDGYDSSTNKYHVNFGWSGEGNAWCSLNSFGYSSYNFNVYQQMVIGIQPPTSSATPTLTVTPSTLSFSATAGQTATKTFTVNGTNLTGDITLTKTDANGVYTISPTTITASAAASGATVTVTYNPTAAGTHAGTIKVSSSGATDVNVSLSGTATAAALETYTPVMSAANSSYITTNSFRADWTDQTASANVASYTLQVNGQGGSTPSTGTTLLGSIDGSNYTGSYKTISLTSPWGGSNVKGGNSAVYFTKSGKITFTIPSGYSNATFSVKITTVTGTYGTGNVTVASTNTSAVGHTFAKGETYTWIVTGSAGETITLTTTDTSYSPDMALIEVYAGNTTLNATETGDATARTITGITNKYRYS